MRGLPPSRVSSFDSSRAVVAHQAGGFVQQLAALERRQAPPVLLRVRRLRARAPHVVGGAVGNLREHFERRGVHDPSG